MRKLTGKALSREIGRRELAFRNKQLKDLFSKEADDVKEKVETYRLQLAQSDNEDKSTKKV